MCGGRKRERKSAMQVICCGVRVCMFTPQYADAILTTDCNTIMYLRVLDWESLCMLELKCVGIYTNARAHRV